MAIGAIGPWAKSPLGISVSGLDGSNDGWLILGCAALAGSVLFQHYRSRSFGILFVALVVGVVGTGIAYYDRDNINDKNRPGGAGGVIRRRGPLFVGARVVPRGLESHPAPGAAGLELRADRAPR